MDSWFSGQGDRAFLFESNDMQQEVFLASYEGIPAQTKYRLKQDYFYQLSKEDDLHLEDQKKKSDFQLQEGWDLIQGKTIRAEIWFWAEVFCLRFFFLNGKNWEKKFF